MLAPPQMQPSQTVTLDAPVGGWDAFSSLDNMPPDAAIVLDNLIPSTGTVDTRKGTTEFVDLGTAAPVETVAGYEPRDPANSLLVAASDGGVWSIDSLAATNTLAAAATFTNSRWQHQNFRKADEEGVLILTNGDDTPQAFDGTALNPLVFTDVDGGTLAPTFIGCFAFKGRMYYWERNDNAFWYAQAASYQGVIQKFDLGTVANRGGHITLITSWTQQDSGDGKDDFLVIVMSTGETLIYQGDDPEEVDFFELVGKYYMAPPLSIRGADRYGSDTIIMTRDGYVGLASIVQQGRTSDVPAFSRLIHRAIKARTETNATRFGWEGILFQKQGLFIFNVPTSDSTYEQHVMNTVTQKWCRFTKIQCECFAVQEERLFGGTVDGRILGVLEGPSDEGSAIQFKAVPAYNYFGRPGAQKHLVAAQLITTLKQPQYARIRGVADYREPYLIDVQPPPSLNEGVWDQSDWDDVYWAQPEIPGTKKGWQNISAYGFAVSFSLRFALFEDSASWRATNVRFYESGAQ